MNDMGDAIHQAAVAIRQARGVFVLTGAGVSAESGVPTFRDAGGFWKKIDPYKVATPEAFAEDPKFVWEWYDARRTQLAAVQPNPSHFAIARLEKQKELFFLLTQNVDDLHEQAGSTKLAHIHGKIWEVRCTREGTVREDKRAPLPILPPRCENCGALERPNVVWFGEMIDGNAAALAESFLSQTPIDVVIVIGTEASFGYIMDWSTRKRGSGGALIEVNAGTTGLTPYADIHLCGKAGELLPQIIPTIAEG
ncbi:MAG: NAD-dependent deacylase [Candidatus Omnitrophota bacterium]|jgi:NAD-dependent deacetylase|nr:MAG: NAD-dependent deacylase [Candidatus Omnitrophota bacterium]